MPLGFWGPACRVAMLTVADGTALVASVQGGSFGPLASLVAVVGGTGGVVRGLSGHGGALAVLADLVVLAGLEAGEALAGLVAQVGPAILLELGVPVATRRRGQPRTPPFGGCGR